MKTRCKIPDVIKNKFRHSTLSFLFIMAYVTIFPMLLGAENSIVAVIFTIMMSASMVRDLTAEPVRHLIIQSAVLVWMAAAAFLVNTLPSPFSFGVNFVTLLVILYAFTYEYSSHIYFPYILSYLFLIFISPVDAAHLPKRMLAMAAGAVSIIVYQLVMGRKRVAETARDVLTEMIDDIIRCIALKLEGSSGQPDLEEVRSKLCLLSRTVYDRRKRILCVSDASFSMIAAGRGLEHLLILINELPDELSSRKKSLLSEIEVLLAAFRSFLQKETADLPPVDTDALSDQQDPKAAGLFCRTLLYIRDRLLHMTDRQSRNHYRKTALSLKVRIQAALDYSPVRGIYALRTALLLSGATLLVQLLGLPHGKWLLFTLASVSLPYADDVPAKMKKRILATIIGGLVSVVIYTLVPSSTGRTAIMMLSGYLSFYFTDYTETFACSTVGALGGAVFMSAFGLPSISYMFLIRMGYILAGAALGFLINCLVFPYSRSKATKQLWEKYKAGTELLTEVCRSGQTDPQLYYHLVIQAHMQEEKLSQNADLENWKDFPRLLEDCKEQVRKTHRKYIAGREDAPAFESGHIA